MLIPYGLALSGGGARGIAHLGVLKALEEARMLPGIVSGSSAGAVVAALYAAGLRSEEIFALIHKKSLYSLVKMGLPNKGMMELSYFREVLERYIPHDSFDALSIPLYITVTNLNKGGCEVIHSGKNLARYVIASATIPLIFKPVQIDGHLFVDGGVINNLPVEPLREKTDILIGVNVNTVTYIDQVTGIRDVGIRCLDISLREHVQHGLRRCDLAIEPDVHAFGIFDLQHAQAIFEAGYDAAKTAILAFQQKQRNGTDTTC